ncbi:MAG: efflux RND transporter periplasmic adaptor subunit [Gemmataceae bacterium]
MAFFRKVLRGLVPLAAVGVITAAVLTREQWLPFLLPEKPEAADEGSKDEPAMAERVRLSPTARANLGIVVRALKRQSYWKSLTVPGTVTDRPGVTDRGVTSPLAGVVTEVHARPGDVLRPSDKVATLRVVSESVQTAQAELYKLSRDIEIAYEQRSRLAGTSVPEARLLEIDQQVRRLQAAAKASRLDLSNRGFTPEQIDAAAAGQFVREVTVVAPPTADALFEVEELKANLGEQVQAGQAIAVLSDHRSLFIEGHAFRSELPAVERAAREGWPVAVLFPSDPTGDWPSFDKTMTVAHMANTADPASRTFGFFLLLPNQSRTFKNGNREMLIWRFRPGQRVRLRVPVERFDGVYVVPADAVVRDGPEAFAFQQNGAAFDRIPVRVLHEDSGEIVLSPEGLATTAVIAANQAAALNRALRPKEDAGHGHSHEH